MLYQMWYNKDRQDTDVMSDVVYHKIQHTTDYKEDIIKKKYNSQV